jgi:hypothetical protein
MVGLGLHMKIEVIVHRCFLIGLDAPSEPAVGHIIATMLAISASTNLDPQSKHALVLDFKKKLKTKFYKSVGAQSLVEFPMQPRNLPEELYASAYSNSPPTDQVYDLFQQDVPLRRTSTKLKAEPSTSSASSLSLVAHQPQDIGQQIVQGLLRGFMHPTQTGHTNPGIPSLQIFKPPSAAVPTQAHALPIQPPHVAASLALPAAASEAATMPVHEVAPPLPIEYTQTPPATHQSSPTQHQSAQKQGSSPLINPPVPEVEFYSQKVIGALAARDDVKKRPAAKSTSQKAAKKKTSSPKAGSTSKVRSTAASKQHASPKHANKRPSLPGANAGTVFYMDGKIHRSESRQAWRVFIHKSDRCDKAINVVIVFDLRWTRYCKLPISHSTLFCNVL